jgi:hypothetical protein
MRDHPKAAKQRTDPIKHNGGHIEAFRMPTGLIKVGENLEHCQSSLVLRA